MKRTFILAAALCLLCACGPKGYTSYSWEYHEMDDRFDNGADTAAMAAIAKYDDSMASLQEIISYSDNVYSKDKPESGLSNFLADALREFAQQYTRESIDVGIINFGGIRTEMPQGAVRVYDIFAIAPFNNCVEVLTVKGSTLRKIFETMAAKNSVQAISGVRMKIDNNRLSECLVCGKPIDANREYKIATIDFLVTGGDGMDFGDVLVLGDTGVLLRDAYIAILKQRLAAGETLHLEKDGRVVINKSNR